MSVLGLTKRHYLTVITFESATETITPRLFEDARQELGFRLNDAETRQSYSISRTKGFRKFATTTGLWMKLREDVTRKRHLLKWAVSRNASPNKNSCSHHFEGIPQSPARHGPLFRLPNLTFQFMASIKNLSRQTISLQNNLTEDQVCEAVAIILYQRCYYQAT